MYVCCVWCNGKERQLLTAQTLVAGVVSPWTIFRTYIWRMSWKCMVLPAACFLSLMEGILWVVSIFFSFLVLPDLFVYIYLVIIISILFSQFIMSVLYFHLSSCFCSVWFLVIHCLVCYSVCSARVRRCLFSDIFDGGAVSLEITDCHGLLLSGEYFLYYLLLS